MRQGWEGGEGVGVCVEGWGLVSGFENGIEGRVVGCVCVCVCVYWGGGGAGFGNCIGGGVEGVCVCLGGEWDGAGKRCVLGGGVVSEGS